MRTCVGALWLALVVLGNLATACASDLSEASVSGEGQPATLPPTTVSSVQLDNSATATVPSESSGVIEPILCDDNSECVAGISIDGLVYTETCEQVDEGLLTSDTFATGRHGIYGATAKRIEGDDRALAVSIAGPVCDSAGPSWGWFRFPRL